MIAKFGTRTTLIVDCDLAALLKRFSPIYAVRRQRKAYRYRAVLRNSTIGEVGCALHLALVWLATSSAWSGGFRQCLWLGSSTASPKPIDRYRPPLALAVILGWAAYISGLTWDRLMAGSVASTSRCSQRSAVLHGQTATGLVFPRQFCRPRKAFPDHIPLACRPST